MDIPKKKEDNKARHRIKIWMRENGRFLVKKSLNEHNSIYMYSVSGHPVLILDMYSKKTGEYQGFEIFTQAEANNISEAINKFEEIRDQ